MLHPEIFKETIEPTLIHSNATGPKLALIIAGLSGAGKGRVIEKRDLPIETFQRIVELVGNPITIDAWRRFHPQFRDAVEQNILAYTEHTEIAKCVREWRDAAIEFLAQRGAPIFLEVGPLASSNPKTVYAPLIREKYDTTLIAVAAPMKECRTGVLARFATELDQYDRTSSRDFDDRVMPPRWAPANPDQRGPTGVENQIRALWLHCSEVAVVNSGGIIYAQKSRGDGMEETIGKLRPQFFPQNLDTRLRAAVEIFERSIARYPAILPALQEGKQLLRTCG